MDTYASSLNNVSQNTWQYTSTTVMRLVILANGRVVKHIMDLFLIVLLNRAIKGSYSSFKVILEGGDEREGDGEHHKEKKYSEKKDK